MQQKIQIIDKKTAKAVKHISFLKFQRYCKNGKRAARNSFAFFNTLEQVTDMTLQHGGNIFRVKCSFPIVVTE